MHFFPHQHIDSPLAFFPVFLYTPLCQFEILLTLNKTTEEIKYEKQKGVIFNTISYDCSYLCGVNCNVSIKEMQQSNFYWFYLHYLKALSEGASRSDAFFEAQKAYGNALIVDSQNGIRGEGNYQFNLYNLLGYHNFGVLEPNPAFSCLNTSMS